MYTSLPLFFRPLDLLRLLFLPSDSRSLSELVSDPRSDDPSEGSDDDPFPGRLRRGLLFLGLPDRPFCSSSEESGGGSPFGCFFPELGVGTLFPDLRSFSPADAVLLSSAIVGFEVRVRVRDPPRAVLERFAIDGGGLLSRRLCREDEEMSGGWCPNADPLSKELPPPPQAVKAFSVSTADVVCPFCHPSSSDCVVSNAAIRPSKSAHVF